MIREFIGLDYDFVDYFKGQSLNESLIQDYHDEINDELILEHDIYNSAYGCDWFYGTYVEIPKKGFSSQIEAVEWLTEKHSFFKLKIKKNIENTIQDCLNKYLK